MNKGLRISVITVCYNSGATLARTISSVIAQDYPNIEYIVVDGASKDNTAAIIEEYKSHVSRYISEPDKGMYDAMNKGISCATGDVIGFLNADDILADSQVLSVIARALSDDKISASYGDLLYRDAANHIVRYWKSAVFKPQSFRYGWSPAHPTFYAKRACYQVYGGFDLSDALGNDIILMMRWMERYQVPTTYIPKVLVVMQTGGVSNKSWRNIWIQNACILAAMSECQLPYAPVVYFFWKVWDRLKQRIFRPTRKNNEIQKEG